MKHYKKKDFQGALKFYTEGINLEPTNYIFYSNRSATYLGLQDFEKSLQDAEETIKIKSDWAKGYLRKSQALFGLNKLKDASATISKGIELEPNNAQMVKLFQDIEGEMKKQNEEMFGKGGIGNVFSNPNVWQKINADPKLKMYTAQTDYVNMINELQKNPGSMSKYIQDPRIMATFGSLLGVNIQGSSGLPKEEDEIIMEEREEEKKGRKRRTKERRNTKRNY